MKRRLAMAGAKYVVNPVVRGLSDLGLPVPGLALLETTGRKSGLKRRTPVTDGLDGDRFWLVAEHGRAAAYVKNIEADPGVRVRVGRHWYEGTAQIVPGDDPRRRLRHIVSRRRRSTVSALAVLALQTDLITVRIGLAPAE